MITLEPVLPICYVVDIEEKISNYSKLSRYYYAQMQQKHVILWFPLNQEVLGIL